MEKDKCKGKESHGKAGREAIGYLPAQRTCEYVSDTI